MAKDEEKKGNPMADLKWFIIIILAFWFLSKSGFGFLGGINTKAPDTNNTNTTGKSFSSQSRAQIPETPKAEDNNSKWKDMVRISAGSASGANYPNQEYITLQNISGDKKSINITGWTLTNGKDKKLFLVGNDKQVKGVSDRVTIPKGTLVFIPNGVNPQEDIILNQGGRAIIVTGKMPNGIPFEIKTNFKVNKCSGYIENLENYDFTPSLDTSCPSPQSESGVESLDDICYKFVQRMGACHTPEFKDVVYKNKEPLTGFVDDVGNLSSQCKAFLKKNYSYESCVTNHLSDENFFGKEWRVFLHNSNELWSRDRERITLYDKEGKMVDELSYGY